MVFASPMDLTQIESGRGVYILSALKFEIEGRTSVWLDYMEERHAILRQSPAENVHMLPR